MRKVRIFLGVISLLLITLLFLDFTGTIAPFAGWIAKIQFVPALLSLSAFALFIAILTLLVGRVYCSVICPLGIMQDVIIFLRRLFGKKFFASYPSNKELAIRKYTRLGFLGLFVGGGFLGLHFVWLEPYAIYGRIVSFLLSPLYRMGNNALASWAADNSNYLFYAVENVIPSIGAILLSVSFFLLIVLMTLWKGRLWCNTVCPVGTMLGFLARFSFFKMKIQSSSCVKCGACEKICRAQCIDVANGKVDFSRCVGCYDCSAICPKKGISLKKK
jgi:polyferredoxin